MALIAVLGLVALLTLMATAVALASLNHRQSADRYGQALQGQATADSAIRLVLMQLHAAPPHEQRELVAAPSSQEVLGTTVQITIEREAGRIGLNAADFDLLFAVFAAHGWPERDAKQMAARVLDWRDPDDQTRSGGAERRQYAAAGLGHNPRNGPFDSVEELRQLLGGEQVSQAVLDAFSVYTHQAIPLEEAADRNVLVALRWADKHHPNRAAGGPGLGNADGIGALSSTLTAGAERSLLGEVVRIQACAANGTAMACRVAVVRLTGSAERPFQVLAWQSEAGP